MIKLSELVRGFRSLLEAIGFFHDCDNPCLDPVIDRGLRKYRTNIKFKDGQCEFNCRSTPSIMAWTRSVKLCSATSATPSRETASPLRTTAAGLGSYTPEHVKYNGHCLTIKTFRNANFVQTELKNHQDWFLGFYADRRSARLDGIARETLKAKGQDPNPKESWNLLKAQQEGLATLYGSRLSGESKDGVFEDQLRLEEPLKRGKKANFHNREGYVPE